MKTDAQLKELYVAAWRTIHNHAGAVDLVMSDKQWQTVVSFARLANDGLILTEQEKETAVYALLVGCNCAASDVELLQQQKRDADAQLASQLAVRCRHLLDRVKAYLP